MGDKGNQPPENIHENVNRLMEEGDDIRRMIRKPTVEAPLKDHKQATIHHNQTKHTLQSEEYGQVEMQVICPYPYPHSRRSKLKLIGREGENLWPKPI